MMKTGYKCFTTNMILPKKTYQMMQGLLEVPEIELTDGGSKRY